MEGARVYTSLCDTAHTMKLLPAAERREADSLLINSAHACVRLTASTSHACVRMCISSQLQAQQPEVWAVMLLTPLRNVISLLHTHPRAHDYVHPSAHDYVIIFVLPDRFSTPVVYMAGMCNCGFDVSFCTSRDQGRRTRHTGGDA